MTEAAWSDVDSYITARLAGEDAVLNAVLEASGGAGLPPIQVSPAQGRLLEILARAIQARRILEIGTLGGYSTIFLARSLPAGGRLLTLEAEPRHAEVARANLARAGLADIVEVREGPAADTLARLAAEDPPPFDLTFIDADKAGNADYLRWAVRLSRPGSLVVVDNVVRAGTVIDAQSSDPDVQGTRALYDAMAETPGLVATAIQTVGQKGWDGFALALVTGS